MRTGVTLAFAVMALIVSGCGSKSADSNSPIRSAIVKAKQATGFAQYSDIFPADATIKRCSVAAGAPGNVFKGTCSTRVTLGHDGISTVVFAQNFGVEGHHAWTIRVAPNEPPNVVRDSGSGLVQLMP